MKKKNNNSITLVGYMGVGKTVIGRNLARKLDIPFYDLDEEIEKKHAPKREILSKFGEPYWRMQEELMIREIFFLDKRVVLSLGGGAFHGDSIDIVNDYSMSVFLYCDDMEKLWESVKKSNRPLLPENYEAFVKLYDERFDDYMKAEFDLCNPRGDKAIEETTNFIIDYRIQS